MTGGRTVFAELKKLIGLVSELHMHICEEWKSYCDESKILEFNQSKNTVCDVFCDERIYTSIFQYQAFLVSLFRQLDVDFGVRMRIKAKNSIEDKLSRYMQGEEKGKIPIRKCLNDIFGIRAILHVNVQFEEIRDLVANNFKNVRVIDSTKHEQNYCATHLYFHHDNNSFDWELQIWYSGCAKSNEASHKAYKQRYTSWENENKENKENKEE